MSSISASNWFESTIIATFGDRGSCWLANLPDLLEQTAEKLELRLLPPYPNLTYNYVAPAVCSDGRNVVIKLGVPNRELTSEILALQRFAGRGCAEILNSDAQAGILILERLIPGVPLTSLADDHTDSEATSIACAVMRSLHRELPAGVEPFPSVSELGQGFARLRNEFNGGFGPFPQKLIEEAERLWLDLVNSTRASVLLHGDLHHDNIVSATRAPWLAIDPKGYTGDAAFETGPLIRNLWQDRHVISNPARTIERRIDQFADELKIDRERIKGWGLAQAVLSVWWSYEDGDDDWADSLETAYLIAGIRD